MVDWLNITSCKLTISQLKITTSELLHLYKHFFLDTFLIRTLLYCWTILVFLMFLILHRILAIQTFTKLIARNSRLITLAVLLLAPTFRTGAHLRWNFMLNIVKDTSMRPKFSFYLCFLYLTLISLNVFTSLTSATLTTIFALIEASASSFQTTDLCAFATNICFQFA